jgi:hypothetical protein
MAGSRQPENSSVLCLVFLIALGFLALVGWAEYAYNDKNLDAALFWLQMFTGSSWPTLDGARAAHPVRFAFGAVFQIMMSVGPLLGVLWLLVLVLTERRRDMFTYNNVLADRDAALKLAIKKYAKQNGISKNPADLQKELDGLFKDATTDWSGDLPELLGNDEAKKFLDELAKER